MLLHRCACAAALLLLTSAARASVAPFPVGFLNVTVQNGTDHFPAKIWYPIQSDGRAEAFPLVAFAHCLFGGDGWYGYLVDALVPSGYIVASVGYHDFLPAESKKLAQAQLQMYYWVLSMGLDPSSPLYGIVGSTASVMGHSLGGSSTLLLAEGQSPFVSAIPLSGCMVGGAGAIRIPLLLITGTSDCICSPAANSEPVYRQAASRCKLLADIRNATHCNFAQFSVLDPLVDSACALVEIALGVSTGCTSRAAYAQHIPSKEQFALTVRYAAPFLDWTLKGNSSSRLALLAALRADAAGSITNATIAAGCDA